MLSRGCPRRGDLGVKCKVGGVGFRGDPGVNCRIGGISIIDEGDGDLEGLMAMGVDSATVRAGDELAAVAVNDVVDVDELDDGEIVDLGRE